MHYGSILCGATPRRNWEAPARCCGTRWDAAWPASCVRWSGHHKTVRTWNAGFIVWNLQWKTSFVIYNDSEAIFIHSKCACKVSFLCVRSQTICKSYARKNTHRELINIHEATLMFFRNTWADRMVLRQSPSEQNYSDRSRTDIHPTLAPSAGCRSEVDPSSFICWANLTSITKWRHGISWSEASHICFLWDSPIISRSISV